MNDKIVAIAKSVRDWAEQLSRTKQYPEDLLGLCAVTAAEIHKKLMDEGIYSIIVMSEMYWGSHCYCIVDDHVVDVTATQFPEFKDEKVLVKHSKEMEVYEYYTGTREFGSVRELVRYQKKHFWDSKQIAYV